MTHPAGESDCGVLRLDFDRRLKLEFHGSQITSDAGLLAFRELDDVLGLSQMAGSVLTDTRTGRNSRHGLVAQFRQSVFGRLAGYEDVNDADRLGCDPAMRFIVGGRAVTAQAASTSQMGRFELIVHGRYMTFQMAEVAVPRDLFRHILQMIDGLRPQQIARC